MNFKLGVLITLVATFSVPVWAKTELTSLIEQALMVDATRDQIYSQSQAIRDNGSASATMADPKLKLGIGGLPTDTFDLDQDPMTNMSVGLMQEFGRGSTLDLQKKMANQQADGTEIQIKTRELDVANTMTQLWAELVYQQRAEKILLENKTLLKELVRFMDTNYSMGRSESQDVLQARIQLSKLEDQLQTNTQMQGRIKAQLSEWLGEQWLNKYRSTKVDNQFDWSYLESMLAKKAKNETRFYDLLVSHPSVQVADAAIKSNQVQVEIADESYSPKFGVEVMYAHREADGMGGEPAPDLVSAYLTMDLPLFTDKRQDKQYAAAQSNVGAAKSARDVMLKQMNSKVNSLLIDRNNLKQRLTRYNQTLLTQAKERLRAVERGYENNTAQFNDVVAAIRDQLTLSMERYRLEADLNIANSNLAYLLGGFNYQVTAPTFANNNDQVDR